MASLFCMGNPLLDISAPVPPETLTKYGVEAGNAILAEEKHLPVFEELAALPEVEYIAGGATQNSARVCQWALQRPGAVTYVGCIGRDNFGEKLETAAKKDGINVLYQHDETTPTGTCAVLVVGKERSLIANLGASEKATQAHAESPAVTAALDAAKVIYISSFFLTHSADTITAVCKKAAEANKIMTMNLSAPFLLQVPPFAAKVKEFMPYLDFVFGNESEAAALAEMYGWDAKASLGDIAKQCAALPKINGKRPRHVVITNGDKPTVIASSTGEVFQVDVPPVPSAEVVDTNGAGDAMVGGFLSQLLQDRELKKCAEIGHWAAGLIIRRSGCCFPDKPDRADL
eukprot:CAMPEP_0175963136 /NCGR_PEP_ID=MMETSP0108-20121206/36858_1 /TAXON_ID=195067 ORGANISM="Goniomonas pacifica, Strain CCMP1869" /NCGR_SAMPLE_ID=MMETSP0108 /ASSEMBLY_ACC=CAM_ASM_000204 /LENGTH=344 /DNA_ID=CAMNT_0017291013 /DNA_START=22 /DNA_END=1056 /DNA_ORIENTATION=+